MKTFTFVSLIIVLVFALLLLYSGPLLAINLKFEKRINLTESGKKELRPEIHVVERKGGKKIFIVRRKIPSPFLIREFLEDSIKQSEEIPLFPARPESQIGITDFGSIFVNESFFLVAQYREMEKETGFKNLSKKRPSLNLKRRNERLPRERFADTSHDIGEGTAKLNIQKYDKDFKLIKSVLVMKESIIEKKSLISGGKEAESLIIEQGDDPGVVSDGERIYVITELRKRGDFKKDEPQYRVHVYDQELNQIMVKDISAGRFNGGFQKLINPIYYQKKFWLLGEFVTDGYGDPDLPPRLQNKQHGKKNKDLFVMQYDRNWNPIGDGWQLTNTYPGIEYYATGFLPYKDFFFVTYSFATDIKSKNRGRLGDGEMYLSIFDKSFKKIKDIKVSEKICTQGNLVVSNDRLLVVYVEKELPDSTLQERVKGKIIPIRADIIMKIFKIQE